MEAIESKGRRKIAINTAMNMFDIGLPFYNELKTILHENVVNLHIDEINILYQKWNDEFDENIPYLIDTIAKTRISEKQSTPEYSRVLGIDFPTWFGEYSKKKILFLGIDPVRNEKEFAAIKKSPDEDIIIGTPYAFHLKRFREKRCAAYWQVIDSLRKDHFVYVTDIFKTFFYQGKLRSYDYWNSNENKVHIDTLKAEIKFIKPDLIVTFGAIAYSKIVGQVPDIPILSMMHLSGSVRFRHLQPFLAEQGYLLEKDNRIEAGKMYAEIIKKRVNETKI